MECGLVAPLSLVAAFPIPDFRPLPLVTAPYGRYNETVPVACQIPIPQFSIPRLMAPR
jgi:hypothetical protein